MQPTTWTSEDGRRWRLRDADPSAVDALAGTLGIAPPLARVLVGRGWSEARARDLIAPESPVRHAPEQILGLPKALERIRRAMAGGEHVRLVTDYDVDGTMSCLVLHAALDRLITRAPRGATPTISYHVPDRFLEGYGLSARAVEAAAAEGVTLLVTADIGVRDHATVKLARERGLDVLIVDHHLPAGEDVPPDALAVLCPPQPGCPYPNKALAACGVSYKLAEALLADDPARGTILRSLGKLVAIGTVADVVDLSTAENRSLVRDGLEALNEDRHGAGLAALLEVAGTRGSPITAATLGWRIGPRINAAGRLEDANAVVRLLRERDPASARTQAMELDRLNGERQEIQNDLMEQALARIPEPLPGFVVVSGPESEGWHRGVVGIVASKLRERVNRPVAVVSLLGEGRATGSVRSIPGVHAVRALDSCADLFHRYGGHAAAAGFSLAAESIPELARRLATWVDAHHDAADLAGEEPVDVLLAGALQAAWVSAFEQLEPTGKGMEAPRVAVEGPMTRVQARGKHLFFHAGGTPCVWWSGAEHAERLEDARVAIGSAEIDTWNGRNTPRLRVETIAR